MTKFVQPVQCRDFVRHHGLADVDQFRRAGPDRVDAEDLVMVPVLTVVPPSTFVFSITATLWTDKAQANPEFAGWLAESGVGFADALKES